MNKKEILEIKKQLTAENCALTRICGCYVDREKNKKMEMREAFLSLPEEEEFKYFEIFKKLLSGGVGKNLLSLDFPLSEEKPGGAQELLLRLRDSRLTDEEILDEVYDGIIESYTYAENYLILLVHGAYDIPGRASDGTEMDDASEEVYEYVFGCICPVKLAKPGLYYNSGENCIQNRIRDWLVEMPMTGFLFPAFNDRSSDIHSALYYTKKANDIHSEMIEGFFHCPAPLPEAVQRDNFNALVEDTFGNDLSFGVARGIHDALAGKIKDQDVGKEPLKLSKSDVCSLLSQAGDMDHKKRESFENAFEEYVGDGGTMLASNLTNTRKFEVETNYVNIKVDPAHISLVEEKIVDGRLCLVIPVDGSVKVNGMDVH